MEQIQLFTPGSLGTCWYGKYHYLEPWAGCEHMCSYCYARCRTAVSNTLQSLNTDFCTPKTLMPEAELLKKIEDTAASGDIKIVKLCRYTDILTPKFVKSGLSLKVLQILADSKIERIIITTKGLPNQEIIDLIKSQPKKFSYSAACRPSAVNKASILSPFDQNLYPLEKRLDAAAQISSAGVLTTIHLDPFAAGEDDRDDVLLPFLDMLEERKLKRVMWSYLLLSPQILENIKLDLTGEALEELTAKYDISTNRMILPKQDDTVSFSHKNSLALESVDKTAKTLISRGFRFVLCSLKSIRGLKLKDYPREMICDGTFYA